MRSPLLRAPERDVPSLAQRVAMQGLLVPTGMVVLTLKGLRLLELERGPGSLSGWLDMMASDVALVVGLTFLGLALVGRTVQRRSIWLLTLICLGVVYLEMIFHKFHAITGSTLDWLLLTLYFDYPGELWGMATISTEWSVKALAVGVSAFLCVFPWVLASQLRRKALRGVDERPGRWMLRSRAVMGLLGVSCLGISCLFPLAHGEQRLGRSAVIELARSGLVSAQRARELGEVRSERAPLRTLSPRVGATPRSIVLIILESTGLRATSLIAEGPPTTPHLRAHTTQRGLSFRPGLTVVPHTSKALFAIHCGAAPAPVFAITEAGSQGSPVACLPELLREHGYQTALFQGATLLWEHNYSLLRNMGYEVTLGADDLAPDVPRVNYFGYDEQQLIAPSRAWLQQRERHRPFLLSYVTLVPHHDYTLPTGYAMRALHAEEEHNRYLNAVSYSDTFFRDLMTMLEEEGLHEEVIVIVVGDHGEAFGEHERYQHDNVVYQEVLEVPLIFSGPGVTPGEVNTPASQLDIMATAAHLAGFELAGGTQGVNLMDEEARYAPRLHFAYCWYERRCAAVIDWPHKLVHHFGEQPEELFDLSRDPGERHNLLRSQPDAITPARISEAEVSVMRDALQEWLRRARALHAR